mmetsp:Transcript_129147/g.223202  ORF Transcript_129147/g.223202 Transcript_129147/m.223202 type:complete len:238 (-) Transcript_129147:23-736(-)
MRIACTLLLLLWSGLAGAALNRTDLNSSDVDVLRVRLFLIPLDGASVVWQWLGQPWATVGCLVSHPLVIVTNSSYPDTPSEFDIFRAFEYHPTWPPLVKFIHGQGSIYQSDSPTWTPQSRYGYLSVWREWRIDRPTTLRDVETWSENFAQWYSIGGRNCQHYSVQLIKHLTGDDLGSCWLHNTVSTTWIALGFMAFCTAVGSLVLIAGKIGILRVISYARFWMYVRRLKRLREIKII